MCYDEGQLLAYLDGEVSAEERDEMRAHVESCASCAGAVRALEADRGVAAAALGTLQPAATVVPLAASRAPVAPTRRARLPWTRIAAAAAAVLVVASFALPPVRSAAAAFLQIFRVQKIQTVTLTEGDLSSIASAVKKGGHVDLKAFGEAWVEGAATSPKQVTLDQAKAAIDFTVKLPTGISTAPVLTLTPAQTYKFKLNVAAVNQALASYGASQVLPDSVDGKVFSISVPAVLVASYPASSASAGASGDIYVGQARSPELVVPQGVDPSQLRSVLLSLPFIPQSVRDQLAAVSDWQSTLLVPNVDGTAHDVTIGGVPAVVISPKSPARTVRSKVTALGAITDSTTIVWDDAGVVRAIGGPLDEKTATALATSIMR
jgi:hypothetical protein